MSRQAKYANLVISGLRSPAESAEVPEKLYLSLNSSEKRLAHDTIGALQAELRYGDAA